MQDWQWEMRNQRISDEVTRQLQREESMAYTTLTTTNTGTDWGTASWYTITSPNYVQTMDNKLTISPPKEEEVTFGTAKCHLCNAAMKIRKQSAYTKYGKKNALKIKVDTLVNEIEYQCGTKVKKTTELNGTPQYSTIVGKNCIKIDCAEEVNTTGTV